MTSRGEISSADAPVAVPGEAPDGAEVARVLIAIGEVMDDLHRQSLALQDAVAALVGGAPRTRSLLRDIQGLDLTTQVHADLARFLPALAQLIPPISADSSALRESLTLGELKARLAGDPHGSAGPEQGEAHLF